MKVQSSPLAQVDSLPHQALGTLAAYNSAAPLNILRIVMEAGESGQRVALVTITHLIGVSSRSVGTLMGVAEAREAIREGRHR